MRIISSSCQGKSTFCRSTKLAQDAALIRLGHEKRNTKPLLDNFKFWQTGDAYVVIPYEQMQYNVSKRGRWLSERAMTELWDEYFELINYCHANDIIPYTSFQQAVDNGGSI